MKKIYLLIVILAGVAFGQVVPEVYKTDNPVAKTNDATQKGNSIVDIISNETDNIIILGTSKGLSISEDNAQSWNNFYKTNNFGTESITAVTYKNGVIYAASGHSEEKLGSSEPVGSGLHVSTDMGATWFSTPQPLDDDNDTTVVYGVNNLRALPVTTTVNNITYDVEVIGDYVYIATFAGGLRRSSNYGETWERVVLPPDNLRELNVDSTYSFALQPVSGRFGDANNLNHRVFSIASEGDSVIYVGTADGVNKGTIITDPNSEHYMQINWNKFTHSNSDSPISGNFVTALDYNEYSGEIYAATRMAEGATEFNGISISSDGGETWEVYLQDIRAHNFGYYSRKLLVATDDGIFSASADRTTWKKPVSIMDEEKQITINPEGYYSGGYFSANGRDNYLLGTASDGLIVFSGSIENWSGDWQISLASEELKSETDTYAFPNPFSPNQEDIRIKYTLGGSGSKSVTVRIFNFGMKPVRTLVQNIERETGKEYFEFWNGLDDYGNTVANGVYFYRIDIGGNDAVFGKIMVIK